VMFLLVENLHRIKMGLLIIPDFFGGRILRDARIF